MKLKLKKHELKMKITPEREAFFYLYDRGFTEKEIEYIRNSSEKEGVKFCIKTFLAGNLKSLRKYLDKKYDKENEEFYKDLFKSVEGVDVELAMTMLVS